MASPSPHARGAGHHGGRPGPPLARSLLVVAGMLTLALALGLVAAPDDPAPETVGLTQPGPHLGLELVGRGWILGNDGTPPVGVDGMRLTDTVEIGYEEPTGWLRLGAGWSTGGTRWGVLWCDLPELADPAVRSPALTLTFDEGDVSLPCAARDGTPAVTRLTPLPPAGPDDHPTPEHVWEGDLPREGGATLGIYLELYGAPLRTGRVLPPPPPAPAAVALDSTTIPVRHGGRSVRVAMVELTAHSRLELWAGGPGLLRVSVDGRVVTDDGDLADEPDWADQDPDLRDGFWHAGREGATRTLELPPDVLPPDQGARTVVISVGEDAALPGAWSVHVTPGTPVEPRGAALPTPLPVDLPDVPGMTAAAAWQVPGDGHPHDLPVPDLAAAPSSEGTAATPVDPWSWKYVVVSDDPRPGVPATLLSADRGRAFPRVGTDALTAGTELIETVLRQRDQARPAGERSGRLAVTLAQAPGQPLLQVLAFRPDDVPDPQP